jgi:hypothetical protein
MPEGGGGQKKTLELLRTPWKPPIDLCELTILSLGPTSHVNPFIDVKVNSTLLSNRLPIHKSPPTF